MCIVPVHPGSLSRQHILLSVRDEFIHDGPYLLLHDDLSGQKALLASTIGSEKPYILLRVQAIHL